MACFRLHRSLGLLALLLLCAPCIAASPANDDARLYVDFTQVQATTQSAKFLIVLSKAEVRKDLQLTDDQIAKIADIGKTPMTAVPAVAALLAQAKAADRAQRFKLNVEAMNQYEQYLVHSESEILTTAQSKRLQQVMWQVDGLKALGWDHDLTAAVGVSSGQLAELANTLAEFRPVLVPLYRRMGRQSIAGLSGEETMNERTQEVERLSQAIVLIEKQQEYELFSALTPAQRDQWARVTGKPIRITWDPNSIFPSN
jgi:hypothetical protein